MDMEINEIPTTSTFGDSSLLKYGISFLKSFFWQQPSRGCCSGGVQESAGEAPVCWDVISTKLQNSFK